MSDDPLAASKKMLVALKKMKEKVIELEGAKKEPLAIIGMSCRFPGSNNCDEYWQMLDSGKDAISVVPKERWDIEAFYDENPETPGKMYTKYGGFVENVANFDASFFGISPREATSMDPQHRIFLEVTWEALEHARQISPALRKSNTGVFVGASTNDYSLFFLEEQNANSIDAYFGTGNAHSAIAGRISYLLGLQGPSFSVDTACSSSLVALHLACQSLRSRECDMAIAGGVNLTLIPFTTINFCKARMMAPDGRCKTFDELADGYVRGEGCGVIVVKRLSDALKNKDNILAVVKGTAVNQDGPSGGFTAPNGPSQEAVILSALENGNVKPQDVDYIEAHGTGTSLGDPIEVQALANSLRSNGGTPLKLGSVKTNIGHLEAAAGIAGIIKLVLSLQNEKIPKHLHFQKPSSYIPWDELAVEVTKEASPWKRGEKERVAGVSSFGFIGTNAHVVIAESPHIEKQQNQQDRSMHILAVSAKSESALQNTVTHITKSIQQIPENELANFCYTINSGKGHFNHRIAVHASNQKDIVEYLQNYSKNEKCSNVVFAKASSATKTAFLFTGQGSQYPDMGKALYQSSTTFKKNMDVCAEILKTHAGYDILKYIYPQSPEKATCLDQTQYTQPALFCLEYSLAKMWMSWGIEPDFVLGHSVGEYVAATIAEVFDLESGLKLIAKRAELMQSLPLDGTMLSVYADETTTSEVMQRHNIALDLAALNGPKSTVVSGKKELITLLKEKLDVEDITSKELSVSHAFHSRLMEPILGEFKKIAESISYHAPEINIVSNITGDVAEAEVIANATYWTNHIRATVKFVSSIHTLTTKHCNLFLELGPQPVLSLMAKSITKDGVWSCALRKGREDWSQVLASLANLYVHGLEVDWQKFDNDYIRYSTNVPTYAFDHQKYWVSTGKKNKKSHSLHPFIESKISSPVLKEKIYTATMSTDIWPEVNDHKVYDFVVFPGAGYLEMATAVQKQSKIKGIISNVMITEPLILDSEYHVQLIQSKNSFSIYSSNDENNWKLNASGEFSTKNIENKSITLKELQQKCSLEVSISHFYDSLAKLGLHYGSSFQCLQKIYHDGSGQVLAYAESESNSFHLNPCLLDSAFQAFSLCLNTEENASVYIPIAVDEYSLQKESAKNFWITATLRSSHNDIHTGDIILFSESGEIIASVSGLHIKAVSKDVLEKSFQAQQNNSFSLAWEESSLVFSEKEETMILFASNKENAARIAGEKAHITVMPGDSNNKEDNVIVVDGKNKENYVWLWQEIAKTIADNTQVHLVYMWSPQEVATETYANAFQAFSLVQSLVTSTLAAKAKLSIISMNTQSIGNDISLSNSSLWGFGRVIMQEHPELSCKLIDVDTYNNNNLSKALSCQDEKQIALREDKTYVLRMDHYHAAEKLAIPDSSAYQMQFTKKGTIDNLVFANVEKHQLGADEVEIEVVAAGLNFRDVMNVLGLYPGDAGLLGGECSGRVLRIGNQVKNVAVGDSVIAIAAGSFANITYAHAMLTIKKPKDISFAEAATIPITFLTAYYGLVTLASIKADDKVLVHSAAGGVGLAAVQIAQLVKAEIFATAGNPEKRSLLKELGVSHVFDSRSLDFKDNITKITPNIDIVLNALAGEYIPKSMDLLKENGHFLEIGKTDIWTTDKVKGYAPIEYCAFDLAQLCSENPELVQQMFCELVVYFNDQKLKPLHHKTFSYQNAKAAFRYMAQAKHIGKIVLERSENNLGTITTNGSYIITGGTGALGLIFATYLAEKGAKDIILVSRQTNMTEETTMKIEEIKKSFTSNILVMKADITDSEIFIQEWQKIKNNVAPLKGIIHAAGVLRDQLLARMDATSLQEVWNPKIKGSLSLYQLITSESMDLDFFVMFSSISSILGAPGQSNYAMANAFLDTFAAKLQQQGIKATTINWGPWSVGMAQDLASKENDTWSQIGMNLISQAEGQHLFQQIVTDMPTQAIVMNLNWNKFAQKFGNEPLFANLQKVTSQVKEQKESEILGELNASATHKRANILAKYVHDKVAQILGVKKLDTTQPLQEIGLDSIMAVEVKNSLEMNLNISLPATLLFNYPNIDAIVKYLITDVLKIEFLTEENKTPEIKPDVQQEQRKAEVEDMSDEEAMELLNQKLHSLDDDE